MGTVGWHGCRVRWTLPDSSHLEDAEALVQDMRGRGAAIPPCYLAPLLHCCLHRWRIYVLCSCLPLTGLYTWHASNDCLSQYDNDVA